MENKSTHQSQCAVLIVDIANSVQLRNTVGEAAGERRIRHLLDAIIESIRERGGTFLKSYGDDVMATFEQDDVHQAAACAVLAQRAAEEAGLGLYAGLHVGAVDFRETMGHPDAVGLTVSVAARLHKLTEGVPGRIFLSEDCLELLKPDLRYLAHPHGTREVKGVGTLSVFTLNWRDAWQTRSASITLRIPDTLDGEKCGHLVLHHGERELRLTEDTTVLIGRGRDCALRMADPERRVSATHLQLERSSGCWLIQDVSRNGTWMREPDGSDERRLPFGVRVMLPGAGELCLGRPFTRDAIAQFSVRFAVT